MFPKTVTLLCGHGNVTILYPSAFTKCGLCGVVTPILEKLNTETDKQYLCARCGHSESEHPNPRCAGFAHEN